MKTHTYKLVLLAVIASVADIAHAGFLLETPPAFAETPKSVSLTRAAPPSTASSQASGRNVDLSAKVDRMARMNRQRVDLESRVTSRITQSGEPPAEMPIIRGMGRDVTLEDALRQVLPAGWDVYSDQDIPLGHKVSWSGNRTWPWVLHDLLVSEDMRANIDWKNSEVMFFAPAVKESITTPVAGAKAGEVRRVAAAAAASAPEAGEAAVADVPKAAVGPAPAPAPVPAAENVNPKLAVKPTPTKVEVKEVVWTLSPEYTLRENLRRWASAANWNLVWNAVNGDAVIDYPVDAKVEFTGELLGINGAMAKVVTAYRDADFPLEIEFFRGNHVVEVRLHRIPDMKQASTDPAAMTPQRVALPKPEPRVEAPRNDNVN